jgi:hypothetical protein
MSTKTVVAMLAPRGGFDDFGLTEYSWVESFMKK